MIKVALAGQPNSGKSTVFNLLSGVYQHIANYPGVTVDKKSTTFNYKYETLEIVDLPGTYSFSSYSLEERVAKDFLIDEKPDIIVNIVDASNIKRSMYLTFSLLETGIPVVVVLNMMDIAKDNGLELDIAKISNMLGVQVVSASSAKGIGKDDILDAIVSTYKNSELYSPFEINYEELEPCIKDVESTISINTAPISKRWLAIKALEGDTQVIVKINSEDKSFDESFVKTQENFFHSTYDRDINQFLATFRYDSADVIFHKTVIEHKKGEKTFSQKLDMVILNRWLAFPILALVMFLFYQLAIVGGYKITDYTWPLLAAFKNFVIGVLPEASIATVPLISDFGVWMVNSVNALLNYIPIFIILFALIAILEDSGYMPRIAFLLDRVFRKFGLHGQSTLPLILGGAFTGGCAVPGIMATKGIADERARMATILTVPYMNCLAKVPFYTLLLGAFFASDMGVMMFLISTVTIFIALIVAKIVTSTVLVNRETTPFMMELPAYHIPTIKGVLLTAWQRVWIYIKKVVTIVMAVAVVLFVMLEFPGLSSDQKQYFATQESKALEDFDKAIENNLYYEQIKSKEMVADLLNFYDLYRAKRMNTSTPEAVEKLDADFESKNKIFFELVRANDSDSKKVNRALRNLSKDRNRLLREIKDTKIENSVLGSIGRSMEVVTMYAGFDWKINIAFLSSFAARESAVATLGSLYENNKADSIRAEEAMAQNSGYSDLHAVIMIIFMILTPPCIASMIVIKLQTGKYRWMMFAIFFPITIGIGICIALFNMGLAYGWSGLETMVYFYVGMALIATFLGILPTKKINWKGGFVPKTRGIHSNYEKYNKN
ncbi:MAG: ferrous iron transport protein B [Arcobacteraceae bacterium]|nr:ferrous iron transport protein B [Arcobacteraceae bacterium]